MGLRVLHKGLILVAVPLALELIVIGALSVLLYQTDREQAQEAERCRLSMIGSRLLFANCQAGNILITAFKMQNIRMLDTFYTVCDDIDRLNKEMSVVPADDAVEGRALQLKCLKAQSAVTARMREIADLASNGFGMGTLREVLASHKKLVKELDTVFSLLRIRYQDLDAGLPDKWRRLEILHEQENATLLSAAIGTVIVAAFMIWFYRREFLSRIKKVNADVESLTLGRTLSSPLPGRDEISQLDASFHNMSMQLAAVAERERALFENSSDMICVLDEELKFIRLNRASARFCKQRGEELQGGSIRSILGSNSEWEIKQIEDRLHAARSTRSATSFEAHVESAEGKQLITLWSAFWSPDQKSCHCVVHDVSEERQLDKMRESFLKLIAGDFSKPLSHVAELVDKLASGSCGQLPEMATSKIVGATGTLGRMVSMVNELLQLETVKSSSLNLARKNTRVRDVLQETMKDTEAAAERKQIKIEIECPDDLYFDVDFDRIVRVLMNFVSNAVKFSPEGELVVLNAKQSSNGDVVLSVIDRGRGIPKEALSSLFQAFKQVSAADGKRGKGTGLGLVVCKRIVEEHGGQVGVESEEGKGSRFWLSIPGTAGGTPASNSASASFQPGSAAFQAASEPGSASFQLASEPKSTELKLLPDELPSQKPAGSWRSQDEKQLPASRSAKGNFWERLSFKQKGVLLVGLPILFQGIFAAAMIYFLNESAQSYSKQLHNRFVCRNAIRTSTPFFQILVALRTEGQAAVGAQTCRNSMSDEGLRLKAFRESVQGDAMATEYYQRVARYLRSTLFPMTKQLMDDLNEYSGQLDESENRRYANVIVSMIGGLTTHIQQLVDACDKRDKDTPIRLKELRQIEVASLVVALIFNLGAAAWLAVFFSSDVVRRLLVLSDNSQRLALGKALNEPLSGSDEIAHLDKVFHDTAKRLAEARATESTFLDNANNIICALDKESRFVSLNKVAAEKLAIPFDSYQEHKLSSLLSESEQSKFEKFLGKLQESTSPASIELKVQTSQGTADIVWSFLWSQAEQQYFAVAYDITARRDLDRMKQEFLALVTHDLRTPLTTIQGMAILLETDKLGVLPPAARTCIGEIRGGSKQILELVNDLLDLSKLEAGELKCELATVKLADLIHKLEDQLEEAGISIHLNTPDGEVPASMLVQADLDRLAYAISGITMELFGKDSVLRLSTTGDGNGSGSANSSDNGQNGSSQIMLVLSGANDQLDATDVLNINSTDMTQYSTNSSRRLRLPLSKKLLQMHNGQSLVEIAEANSIRLKIQL